MDMLWYVWVVQKWWEAERAGIAAIAIARLWVCECACRYGVESRTIPGMFQPHSLVPLLLLHFRAEYISYRLSINNSNRNRRIYSNPGPAAAALLAPIPAIFTSTNMLMQLVRLVKGNNMSVMSYRWTSRYGGSCYLFTFHILVSFPIPHFLLLDIPGEFSYQ